MLATVIVCTRNRPRELDACLAAVSSQTCPPSQVLVVDNGSNPGVADICARWGADYVREPRTGSCFARNLGARLAGGEIIASLDDDAIPEATWLETLLAGFDEPSIGAVTGRIRYMKALDDGGMSLEEIASCGAPRPGMVFHRGVENWFALACLGGIGDGSNMAFRRKVFLESPGFDNRLGRGRLLEGGDEHVVFMSLLALGYRIRHIPEAVVRHPAPATPELMHAQWIRDRRTSIAFLIFLWTEFPAHRTDLLHYLAAAVSRRIRRSCASAKGGAALTYREAFYAALSGVSLYRKAREEWTAIPAPDYRAAFSPNRRNSYP